MGKVWPADAVARNESTTALSNIVSLDESPLLEGLIYAGTDDGLVQVTEDGGKNWRKIEQFPACRSGPTCPTCSPRRAMRNTVFVALNNWQRGDYKPYLVKSTDRGRTWTTITGNLPDRHDVWAVVQDHVNGNLLFAGTEFGVFTSVDGGERWVQLKGGMPPIAGARHGGAEARERSRARHVRPRLLRARRLHAAARDRARRRSPKTRGSSRCATRISSTRSAWRRPGAAGIGAMAGNWTAPNPPFGAVFTFNLRQDPQTKRNW